MTWAFISVLMFILLVTTVATFATGSLIHILFALAVAGTITNIVSYRRAA